jgi:hypothetical protein
MKANRFLLAAGIALAMAFTFSCSSDDDDDGNKDPFLGNPQYEYYDPYDAEERCQNGVVELICKLPRACSH